MRIEFGDGDFEDLGAVAGTPAVSHIYNNDGAYTVKVTVTDSAGQQATQVLGITVLPMRRVSVTLTVSPARGQRERASSLSRRPSAAPASPLEQYDWDFGDGTPRRTTTRQLDHEIYQARGTFTAR